MNSQTPAALTSRVRAGTAHSTDEPDEKSDQRPKRCAIGEIQARKPSPRSGHRQRKSPSTRSGSAGATAASAKFSAACARSKPRRGSWSFPGPSARTGAPSGAGGEPPGKPPRSPRAAPRQAGPGGCEAEPKAARPSVARGLERRDARPRAVSLRADRRSPRGMARLTGSWTPRKWCLPPATSAASVEHAGDREMLGMLRRHAQAVPGREPPAAICPPRGRLQALDRRPGARRNVRRPTAPAASRRCAGSRGRSSRGRGSAAARDLIAQIPGRHAVAAPRRSRRRGARPDSTKVSRM